MTATKRPRAQRAGCHDAMLLLAACCGVKLLLVAVLVAVAAGPWALGILVALLGGLGVALARAERGPAVGRRPCCIPRPGPTAPPPTAARRLVSETESGPEGTHMTTHGTSSDTRSAAPAIGPSPAERHEPSRPGCGASGAIGAGLVASGPAWLSAGLAACTSCVSAGGTAFAGAAGGAGLSTGGIALGVVLLGVVAGVQLLRLRRVPDGHEPPWTRPATHRVARCLGHRHVRPHPMDTGALAHQPDHQHAWPFPPMTPAACDHATRSAKRAAPTIAIPWTFRPNHNQTRRWFR